MIRPPDCASGCGWLSLRTHDVRLNYAYAPQIGPVLQEISGRRRNDLPFLTLATLPANAWGMVCDEDCFGPCDNRVRPERSSSVMSYDCLAKQYATVEQNLWWCLCHPVNVGIVLETELTEFAWSTINIPTFLLPRIAG